MIGALALAASALTSASQCVAPATRERVRDGPIDYELVRFTSSNILSEEPRFAWSVDQGLITFGRGVTVAASDPILYQMWRYDPAFSYGLVRSGQSLVFQRVSLSDRTIPEIRLAASPQSAGIPDTGRRWLAPRPAVGPHIPGYRFQMAERLSPTSFLGLWRRSGSAGARTLLVYVRELPDRRDRYRSVIVGRSELAFSLISLVDNLHGNLSLTLFTEATCPQPIMMLSYTWYPRWPPERP